MSKVKSLLRLYTEGVSKTAIAERLSLPRNTVKKYIHLFLACGKSLNDLLEMREGELEQFFMNMTPRQHIEEDPRYITLLEYFPAMEKSLKKKGITKKLLWQQYREGNPDGYGYSQFKHYYLRWQKPRKSVMHIEHKAGDKMYVDYTGEKLKIVNEQTGELIDLEVLVVILGSSQLIYAEAMYSQTTEDFINGCENALHYYGGSPLGVVPDNLKAAVIKSSKYEPSLNEAFHDFASHYTMAVMPTAPYKPTHKALVEGAVKIIYREIYNNIPSGVLTSPESVNALIREHLEVLNRRNMYNRPYSRRQMFEESEKEFLQPLPSRRYEIRRRRPVTVMKNNHVYLTEDKHYYSVPYRFIGKKATLLYSQSLVEVFYRYDRIAVHDRDRRPYKYTTVEDHLASKHRYLTDWNPDKFIEKASEIGQACADYIVGIINSKQHPEQAYRSCQGVLSFASRAGKERLNNACLRAMQFNDYGYHTIKAILEKGLDRDMSSDDPNPPDVPPHDNIRGPGYYE